MATIVNSHNNGIAISVLNVLCSLGSLNLKNISPKLPALKTKTKTKPVPGTWKESSWHDLLL